MSKQRHSFIHPSIHASIHSVSQLVSQSVSQSDIQSVSQSVSQSLIHSVLQVIQSVNQSTSQSSVSEETVGLCRRATKRLTERHTSCTCGILVEQYFPHRFTYNSFVEVLIFVSRLLVFSRGAIEIDITRSKLRQESYEARVNSKDLSSKSHRVAYHKHSRKKQPLREGGGSRSLIEFLLDLIKV